MASTSTVRDEVHSLIDEIMTDEEVVALREFLDRLQNAQHPGERGLLRASLLEPEDLSEDEIESIREAKDEVARGEVLTDEELWRSLGDKD